jgi:hypothetical protein
MSRAAAAGSLSLLLAVSACAGHDSNSAAGAPGTGAVAVAMTSHDMAAMSALPRNHRQAALYLAMRVLWAQHMEWTYATVAAFVQGSPGLDATLARLLRNQVDIGNAVKPFYGTKAGDQLTDLLQTHINDAVPVLVAAKNGDTAAFNQAEAAWYANAKQIADFLAAANPAWHKRAMEKMMRTHITQTTTYAADQLQGHFAKSIRDYGTAERHMRDMADMLSAGLVKQFPHRF